ncbi:unnamed protein product [Rotaria sp. Silwood1]|nr:unnamed protein product [Rotaria sp. Silwood1]CAF1588584.1 unnamed protein product [Rotaria sp. Silwood1]
MSSSLSDVEEQTNSSNACFHLIPSKDDAEQLQLIVSSSSAERKSSNVPSQCLWNKKISLKSYDNRNESDFQAAVLDLLDQLLLIYVNYN